MTTGKTTIWTFVGKVIAVWQSVGNFAVGKVICFFIAVEVCHDFSSNKQVSLNFLAAVTVHSDFGAQENKNCHCFHLSPLCLP